MGANRQIQLLPQETATEPGVSLGEHLEEGAEGLQAVRMRGEEQETALGTAGPEQGASRWWSSTHTAARGRSTPEQICAERLPLVGGSHAGVGEKGEEEAAAEIVD